MRHNATRRDVQRKDTRSIQSNQQKTLNVGSFDDVRGKQQRKNREKKIKYKNI